VKECKVYRTSFTEEEQKSLYKYSQNGWKFFYQEREMTLVEHKISDWRLVPKEKEEMPLLVKISLFDQILTLSEGKATLGFETKCDNRRFYAFDYRT